MMIFRNKHMQCLFIYMTCSLERATKLSSQLGKGSVTLLSMIETQARDVLAYICSNIIFISCSFM